MRPRILPCDRVRYAATVAALVAIYGAIVVLDWLARIAGRPTMMPDGRWPWEE